MKLLTKPVWIEGMFLGPHHFQAQARYFEDSLDFAITALWRNPYGFSRLQFNEEALSTGTLNLTDASGLFKDGLSFDFSAADDVAPPVRNFSSEFKAVADHLTMYLAVPEYVRDGQNTDLNETSEAVRYRGTMKKLVDLNTGMDEREIRLAKKNLVLLTEKEISENKKKRPEGGLTRKFVSLPVVRIVRNGGGYAADSSFVAPSLSLDASSTLTAMLGRLLGILEDKSTEFTREQLQRGDTFIAGLSDSDLTRYWFLHALNSSIGPLHHLKRARDVHPEVLYCEMLRLAGALCTFGLKVEPRNLAAYDHDDLGRCFSALDHHIQEHVELVMPSKAIKIPLTQTQTAQEAQYKGKVYQGVVEDERCLGSARWILEIQSPIDEATLIAQVPNLAKVCSAQWVHGLIKHSLTGMKLTYLSSPPPQVSNKVESQYFSIHRSSKCWDHIVESRQLGVFVPDDIPSPKLTIIVVLD